MIQSQDQTCPTLLSLNLQNPSPLKPAQVLVQTDSAAAAAAASGTWFGIGFVGLAGEQGGFSCLWFWDMVWIRVLEQYLDRFLAGTRCPGPVGVQTVFGLEVLVQAETQFDVQVPAGSGEWFGPVIQEWRIGFDVKS